MKRKIIAALLVFVCFLLQTSVFPHFAFNGIVPNLLIVLTASYGFMRGKKAGLLTGFFCGLLLDVFYGDVIGFYALIYMWIGYFNGNLRKIFFPEDIKLPMSMIFLSDLGSGLICYLFMFLLRSRFHFPFYFLHIILPEVVYTVLISMLLYPIILKLNTRLEEIEKRSAQKFV